MAQFDTLHTIYLGLYFPL